jgi:queuine/archaeosine tRNA-ribosyltransferase
LENNSEILSEQSSEKLTRHLVTLNHLERNMEAQKETKDEINSVKENVQVGLEINKVTGQDVRTIKEVSMEIKKEMNEKIIKMFNEIKQVNVSIDLIGKGMNETNENNKKTEEVLWQIDFDIENMKREVCSLGFQIILT